jgi:uncharacterized iron-regulated membrane protein
MAGLVVASLTGTVLVFRAELDRWLNPQLLNVQPGNARRPVRELVARVEAQFPNTSMSSITLPASASDPLVVYLRAGQEGQRTRGTRTELLFSQIYVNPYTAEITGARSTSRIILDRAHFIPLILRLHYTLLLERPGLLVMGGCAIVWFLTNLIGMALSWPTLWRRAAAWLPIVSVRRAGSYKVNYDLHRAFGVALLPVFTVLAFSSIYLNLPELVKNATSAFSPVTSTPRRQHQSAAAPAISLDQAIAIANAAVPAAQPAYLARDTASGWYSVGLRLPGDLSTSGDTRAYIDYASGEVTVRNVVEAGTAGDRFIAWQFPLHSGQAFGWTGRLLIAVTGLCMLVLSVTGFYVWLRNWRARRASRSRLASAAHPGGTALHPPVPGSRPSVPAVARGRSPELIDGPA